MSARLLELLDVFEAEQAAATARLQCDHDGPPAPEDELELHESAYDLASELDRAIAGRRVDWQHAIGLADQLRRAAASARTAADERRA